MLLNKLFWFMSYAHDRRNHRHRCRVCGRVINEGENVWMARISDKGTKAIHEACGAVKVGGGEYTGAELLGVQAVLRVTPKTPEAQALAFVRVEIERIQDAS